MTIMPNSLKSSKKGGIKTGVRLTARRILFVACLLIATGYLLMTGAGTTEQAFCPDIFSTRRIVVAPMLCLAGYLLMIVGILRKGRP
jgi:hypothetical protein